MATKNNPGVFDCYDNAHPDEPMFVLLGRDKNAPDTIEAWAGEREEDGEDAHVVAEARLCAEQMRTWRRNLCQHCREPWEADRACPGRDDPGGPCLTLADYMRHEEPELQETDADA